MNRILWANAVPDRSVLAEGQEEMLWFTGTDYLGLAHHPEFLHFIQEGLSQLGTHYGSSRNNTLRLKIYEEAETLLAGYLGAPAALSVSSGMWAGQLLLKMLCHIIPEPFQVHYAPQVHPAIAGEGYKAEAGSWKGWAEELIQKISSEKRKSTHVILTDGVGSPWVEKYDFSVFQKLETDQQVVLIIDDSHGFGIVGDEGRGTQSAIVPQPGLDVISVGSMNKGLGIPGGVIAGDSRYLHQIRSSGWFSGASPFSPAYAYALVRMIRSGIYQTQFNCLRQNLDFLEKEGLFASPDWTGFEGYPVLCSENQRLHQKLMDHQMLTSCFAYPTAQDNPVVRLVINASHTQSDLKKLGSVLLS